MANGLYLGGDVSGAYCGGDVSAIYKGSTKVWEKSSSDFYFLTYFENLDNNGYDFPLVGGNKSNFSLTDYGSLSKVSNVYEEETNCLKFTTTGTEWWNFYYLVNSLEENFTLSMYLYNYNVDGIGGFVRLFDSCGFEVTTTGNRIMAWYKNSDGNAYYESCVNSTDEFYYATVVYKSGTAYFYINTDLKYTATNVKFPTAQKLGISSYNGRCFKVMGISIKKGTEWHDDPSKRIVPTTHYTP